MNKQWEMVKDFHLKFGHPAAPAPRLLNGDRVDARGKWMQEELDEFYAAKNIYEQADAMIDLIYFALGTLVEMGVEPDGIFEIVHNANMSKLWPDGKPHYKDDGKTRKPPGWQDPEPLLREAIGGKMTAGRPPDIPSNIDTVILIGPKHSGKTSAGRALALLCGGDFTDLDECIEERAGKSARALYREGPGIFRQAEAEALAALFAGNARAAAGAPPKPAPRIIATGGGLVDNEAALSLLRQPEARRALLVYPEVPAETAWARIGKSASETGELPPFLDTENPRETHRLLHERRASSYRKIAGLTIDAGRKPPAALAEEILRHLTRRG
jgi:shikimate kinase